MKKFFTLILMVLIAGSGMCYGQKKMSVAEQKRQLRAQIEQRKQDIERLLRDRRKSIKTLEATFRDRPLTKVEADSLALTYRQDSLYSKVYIQTLKDLKEMEIKEWQVSVEKALKEGLQDANAKAKAQQGDINRLTDLIYEGKANAAEYYDLFKRQTPEARVQLYKLWEHEAKILEYDYLIQQEEQREAVSKLKNQIYQYAGYYPDLTGKSIAKLPTDPKAYDFINDINADRKRFNAPLLTPKEEKKLMDMRDEASKKYNMTDVEKSENKRKLDLLNEGIADLKEEFKDCPKCAELLKNL